MGVAIIELITSLFNFVGGLVKSKDVHKRKKRAKTAAISFIAIFVSLVLFSSIYSGYTLYKDMTNKKSRSIDCQELVLTVDSLKQEINKLKNVYDKYPFDLNVRSVTQIKGDLQVLLNDIGCIKAAINIFHNPQGAGYKPITIYGFNSYICTSVLVSVNNYGATQSYEEMLYQNIPLSLFWHWFKKYDTKGFFEFHKAIASEGDKTLFKIMLIDYENTKSAAVFGIYNYGSIRLYGRWVGVVVFDFGSVNKQITELDKYKIARYCENLSQYLEKYRKL